MYAHALYGAGMRNLKRPVDALEKDLSSVVAMVAGHKKLNTLFQVSVALFYCDSCTLEQPPSFPPCLTVTRLACDVQDPTVSRAAKKDVRQRLPLPAFHKSMA
jgi:hypothetical protein